MRGQKALIEMVGVKKRLYAVNLFIYQPHSFTKHVTPLKNLDCKDIYSLCIGYFVLFDSKYVIYMVA